ncbi:hypothetical protein HZH68_008199 [Vespula germanica]|uniref:Uncharacterized protein n=1 Tax=Vespula germanica TaxID=30212 RepID=A0A834K3S3_VESGE|nr:hypothetical protein HZH68_008199 [Vespula germanica]
MEEIVELCCIAAGLSLLTTTTDTRAGNALLASQIGADVDTVFDVVVDHSIVVVPEEVRRGLSRFLDNAMKL